MQIELGEYYKYIPENEKQLNKKSINDLYFIIKNFSTIIKNAPVDDKLVIIANQISQRSHYELIDYNKSCTLVETIKKIVGIIHNFFTLGIAKNSAQIGLELSETYIKKGEFISEIKTNIKEKNVALLKNNLFSCSQQCPVLFNKDKEDLLKFAYEAKDEEIIKFLKTGLCSGIKDPISVDLSEKPSLKKDGVTSNLKENLFSFSQQPLISLNSEEGHKKIKFTEEIKNNIRAKDIKALSDLLSSQQSPILFNKDKQEILDFAYKKENYHSQIIEFLQTSLCFGIEKKYPILNQYKSHPRALNSTHLKLYADREGKAETQTIYHKQQTESVKYALLSIKEKTCSFRNLLENLGHRRRYTTVLLWISEMEPEQRQLHFKQSKDGEYGYYNSLYNDTRNNLFGTKRQWTPLVIPMNKIYKAYSEKVVLDDICINLDGKEYKLKQVNWEDKATPYSTNCYPFFWENNDPVFAYANKLYDDIVNQTFNDPKELKKSIATFHWLLANCAPFSRGTASILEALTDAMWLAHGYLPQPIERGKSLDLEALCTPESKLDTFIENYPMGLKPAENPL